MHGNIHGVVTVSVLFATEFALFVVDRFKLNQSNRTKACLQHNLARAQSDFAFTPVQIVRVTSISSFHRTKFKNAKTSFFFPTLVKFHDNTHSSTINHHEDPPGFFLIELAFLVSDTSLKTTDQTKENNSLQYVLLFRKFNDWISDTTFDDEIMMYVLLFEWNVN